MKLEDDQSVNGTTDGRAKIAHRAVVDLIDDFEASKEFYFSDDYKEVDARADFIDKLFKALGWLRSSNPYKQEMKIEQGSKVAKGRADYAFSLAPHYQRVRFYVEAKRPQLSIASADNCFQAIRYSWPKGLPISVLTDFNSIHVIDTRFKPNIVTARQRIVKSWSCKELRSEESFLELYWLLSREAVAEGSIESFESDSLPNDVLAARQYSLLPAETKDFDDDFLRTLDDWRRQLSKSFRVSNKTLTGTQLTEAAQRVIDRLVFISFLQDRGIEADQIISNFGSGNRSHWRDFITASAKLDSVYNGVVFKKHQTLDSAGFQPAGQAFEGICDQLTDPNSAYNFDSIPVDILGRIYERFLGSVVEVGKAGVEIVEKADVRRAGGVYYTPGYIVSFMVDAALERHLKGKGPDQLLDLRIIDTSCGSGSFLIATYDALLRAILVYYKANPREAKKGVLAIRDGETHLSLSYRRQVLTKCIYGVDIDQQAVEVAQLSLYLKLMEEETPGSAQEQRQIEMGVALLPSLAANIVVGNSLVSLDEIESELFEDERLLEIKSLNFKRTFRGVFKAGGFDLVIGNPPYIKEFTNRAAFDHVRTSPYYQGKMDIWYMFACRGLDWLKADNGTLALIATNNWVTNSGARKLRSKLMVDAQIEKLIDFGNFQVFRDAAIQTMILIAKRKSTDRPYTIDYRRLGGARATLSDARALLEKQPIPAAQYLNATVPATEPGSLLTFSHGNSEEILTSMSSAANFTLDGNSEIAQGIVAPQDTLNAANLVKLLGSPANATARPLKYSVGQGIFVLSDAEKQGLKLGKRESALLRPYFTTAQLHRFYSDSRTSYWIIYTDSSFADGVRIQQYPKLKAHLDKFSAVITSVYRPYGLHRSRAERFFKGEKILALRKCSVPTFTYSNGDCYVSQTFNVIQSSRVNMHYLTGVLNSKIIQFWLGHRGKMQGVQYQVDKEPLLTIPFVMPAGPVQEEWAKVVKKIIRSRGLAAQATDESTRERWTREAAGYEEDFEEHLEEMYGLDEAARKTILAFTSTGVRASE